MGKKKAPKTKKNVPQYNTPKNTFQFALREQGVHSTLTCTLLERLSFASIDQPDIDEVKKILCHYYKLYFYANISDQVKVLFPDLKGLRTFVIKSSGAYPKVLIISVVNTSAVLMGYGPRTHSAQDYARYLQHWNNSPQLLQARDQLARVDVEANEPGIHTCSRSG